MPRTAPGSIASQLMTNHRLALCTAGAITMTAGDACGLSHNCREERDQNTRDETLETLDQRKAREPEACNGDGQIGEGQIDAADRAAFLVDHANQEIWTDLNGDDASDAGDLIVFDGETSRATARSGFLAAQGVDQ